MIGLSQLPKRFWAVSPTALRLRQSRKDKMAIKMKTAILAGAVTLVAAISGIAYAAGGGGTGDYKMEHKHWHFKGAFGTYDKAAAQQT